MRYQRPSYYSGYTPRGGILPPAIKWLLIINAALFFLPRLFPIDLTFFNRLFGLVPAFVWGKGFIWQLVTYMFLHGGIWHIFINMFVLWMFGSDLEREWGTRQFLKFYFVAGIGAGFVNVIFSVFNPVFSGIPVIGASGAVYGILVAYAMLFPERYVFVYFLIPVKVKYLVAFLVAIEFFLTYQKDGIAHFAHLGGALAGFLYLKYGWSFRRTFHKYSPAEMLKIIRDYRDTRKHKEEIKMMDEVDQILDKINQVGYDNLSRKEKKILEKASDKLSERQR